MALIVCLEVRDFGTSIFLMLLLYQGLVLKILDKIGNMYLDSTASSSRFPAITLHGLTWWNASP